MDLGIFQIPVLVIAIAVASFDAGYFAWMLRKMDRKAEGFIWWLHAAATGVSFAIAQAIAIGILTEMVDHPLLRIGAVYTCILAPMVIGPLIIWSILGDSRAVAQLRALGVVAVMAAVLVLVGAIDSGTPPKPETGKQMEAWLSAWLQ